MDNIAELVRTRLTEELLSVGERDKIMGPLVEPSRYNRVQIITANA